MTKTSSKTIDIDKALKRMETYARKTESSFVKSLKVRAPKQVGLLAGPANKK